MSCFVLSQYAPQSSDEGHDVTKFIATVSNKAISAQSGDAVTVALLPSGLSIELYATAAPLSLHKGVSRPGCTVRSAALGSTDPAVGEVTGACLMEQGWGGFDLNGQCDFGLGVDHEETLLDDANPVLVVVQLLMTDDSAKGEEMAEKHVRLMADELKRDVGVIGLGVLRDGFAGLVAKGTGTDEYKDDFRHVIVIVCASGQVAARSFPAILVMADAIKAQASIVVAGDHAEAPPMVSRTLRSAQNAHAVSSALYVKLLAGYVVHPGLCIGSLHVDPSALAAPAVDESMVDGVCGIAYKRDGVTPHAFRFPPQDESTFVAKTDADNTFVIPVRALLRKLVGREGAGDDVDADVVWPQLGRLRGLLGDVAAMDAYLARGGVALNGSDDHRARCVLANLKAFGFVVPEGVKGIQVPGLAAFIGVVEKAFTSKVHSARELMASDGVIEYGSLFELYHINDIVVAPASSLGGAAVAYRVCDLYWSTLRSAFGGKKLSLHLALECVAALGDALAFISFEEIIGDWEGTQRVANLQYRVVDATADGKLLDGFKQRGADLTSLGVDPAYRSYHEQCFFAHGAMSRGTAASKLAAMGDNAAAMMGREATGRLVVDTRRGMALGHNVATGNDAVSLAVQATVKAYRSVQRSRTEGGDTTEFDDRVRSAGLRLIDPQDVDASLAHVVWPSVVAFSLGLKRWGHVLVNGLSKVEPNPDAWDRLVLPASKKELLLSLVQAAFDPTAPKLRDLVHNKGSGSLFLLHGMPGTGKTLTVEALAERYAVPAYRLTFGELGTSVKELEETMGNVLTLCSGWGALVLLDEGDALVERREKGALLLNSMVGVLLKSLDAFEGLLFITTNRVASFDPAALSRVTLSIRYGSLKLEGRRRVWINVLKRAGVDAADFDVDALAQRGGSGRDINAAARLGLTLAHFRQQPLSQSVLMEVLDVAEDFKKDFGAGGQRHADGGRVSDDDE